MSYIYLASVYSLDAPANTELGRTIRSGRYHEALKWLARYTRKGEVVFSPIVHSHPLAVIHNLDGDFKRWAKIDYAFIDSCSKVRVLKMKGWERSVGVQAEIKYAESIGKEIEYVDVFI